MAHMASDTANITEVVLQPVRVLLLDGNAGLTADPAFGSEPEIAIVGRAATGPEAVLQARALRPDVLLIMDIALRGVEGIAAGRRMRAERPGMTVVGVSVSGEDASGTIAFIMKGASADLTHRAVAAIGRCLDTAAPTRAAVLSRHPSAAAPR